MALCNCPGVNPTLSFGAAESVDHKYTCCVASVQVRRKNEHSFFCLIRQKVRLVTHGGWLVLLKVSPRPTVLAVDVCNKDVLAVRLPAGASHRVAHGYLWHKVMSACRLNPTVALALENVPRCFLIKRAGAFMAPCQARNGVAWIHFHFHFHFKLS